MNMAWFGVYPFKLSDWTAYKGIAFMILGQASGHEVIFELVYDGKTRDMPDKFTVQCKDLSTEWQLRSHTWKEFIQPNYMDKPNPAYLPQYFAFLQNVGFFNITVIGNGKNTIGSTTSTC